MSTHLSNIEGMEMAGKLPEVRLANTPFKVVSPFEPSGDQPEAIAALAKGVEDGLRYQTLLGVTGSGKTFTMAKTIEAVQKPTLVMAPNKTLAAQLAAELKEFFPDNAVVYFVSYYDYYQPEAYVPSSDTFIEKDASINEEVEKLRHAADLGSALAAGRHRGGIGDLHLRHRHPRWTTLAWRCSSTSGRRWIATQVIHELHRHPVRPQRLRAEARHLPRAGRRAGRVPALRRPSHPHRVLGGRDRVHRRDRPGHGRGAELLRGAAHLAGVPLRHGAPEDGQGPRHHPRRAARAPACSSRRRGSSWRRSAWRCA